MTVIQIWTKCPMVGSQWSWRYQTVPEVRWVKSSSHWAQKQSLVTIGWKTPTTRPLVQVTYPTNRPLRMLSLWLGNRLVNRPKTEVTTARKIEFSFNTAHTLSIIVRLVLQGPSLHFAVDSRPFRFGNYKHETEKLTGQGDERGAWQQRVRS